MVIERFEIILMLKNRDEIIERMRLLWFSTETETMRDNERQHFVQKFLFGFIWNIIFSFDDWIQAIIISHLIIDDDSFVIDGHDFEVSFLERNAFNHFEFRFVPNSMPRSAIINCFAREYLHHKFAASLKVQSFFEND